MLKIMAVALAVAGAATVGGCASPGDTFSPSGGTAAPTTAASPTETYLDVVRAVPDAAKHSDSSLRQSGEYLCTQIGAPGITRGDLVVAAQAGYGLLLGGAMVDAAKRHLCPSKDWAWSSASVPASSAVVDPTRVGPLDVIAVDGQWHVGTEETDHVLPGRYRTDGADDCYYAKLDPANPEKILFNSARDGAREVVLNEGDFFETVYCGTWVKQG